MARLRFLFLLPLFFTAAGLAQPLTDRLPASTIVYAGWSPGASLKDTKAARMLADERIMQPWRALLQGALLTVPQDIAAAGSRVSDHFPQLLYEASQCEGCFALLDLTLDKGHWSPRACLVLKLGDHRKAFEEHFAPIQQRLKERLGERVQMMKLDNSWLWIKSSREKSEYAWGFLGDSFVFYLGDGADKFLPTIAAPAADKSKALGANPAFTGSFAKLPAGAAGEEALLSTYVDGKRFVTLVHQLVKDNSNGDIQALDASWAKFISLTGLDNLVALVERTTVHDGRFVTQSLLRTEGEPHGLIANLVQPAVDESMLKLVPQDAMFAVAVRMDLTKAYEGLKAGVVAVLGEDGQKAFGDIEGVATGFGVPVPSLLSPLGDQWVLYEAASTGGFFFTGLTLVVDLKDEAKLTRAIAVIKAPLARQGGADARSPISEYDADGVTIHYVQGIGEMTAFSPAWVVTDKKLFVALYPQVVEDAVRQMKADKSLLDNPEFAAARGQTGGGGPLLYLSNAEFTRSLYPITLPLVSALREIGLMDNGEVNPFTIELLPSLQRLLSYVGGDVVSVRLSADGILRTKSVANPLLTPLTLVDSVPVWVAAALPSLATSADTVDRARSAANLRSIGQNVQLYIVDNNGNLPPDLKALTANGRMEAGLLHSPFDADPNAAGDYRYVVAGLKSPVPADVLMAYDAAEYEKGDGANVLYGDGHVEWLDHDGVNAALEKTAAWRKEQKK